MIVKAKVDREGRLIGADARLIELQQQAGGAPDGQLVVPQLAALVRLARTLAVPVSRSVIVADGENDLELMVRAELEGDAVRLSISGWDCRPVAAPDAATVAARLRDFAKLEADGQWECDAALHLVAIDQRLGRLAGLSASNEDSRPLTRLFRLVEGAEGALPLLEAVAARTGFSGQLAELRANPEIQLSLHGEPKTGSDGNFAGYRGWFSLEDSGWLEGDAPSNAAPAGPEFLGQFESALRAPLARIISNADEIGELSDGPLRKDYVDYARDIASAGRHLLGLVDDLADVRSMEDESFELDVETVDLADLARKAAGLLAVRANDKRVRIDAPFADERLDALGDFRRVLQILVNLIGNAVRYAPEGSSIWVRSEEEDGLAAIVVADQGKGIAAEDQDRIFEKFERVDPSEPGGSGLGLYISRKLARAMGGDITLDSAPGMGARFVLTLPSA